MLQVITSLKSGLTLRIIKYTKKIELSKKSGAGAKRIKEYHLYRQLMVLQKNGPILTEDSIEEESQTPITRSSYQPYRKTR